MERDRFSMLDFRDDPKPENTVPMIAPGEWHSPDGSIIPTVIVSDEPRRILTDGSAVGLNNSALAYWATSPWHGKGTKMAEGTTIKDGLIALSLDLPTELHPVTTPGNVQTIDADGKPLYLMHTSPGGREVYGVVTPAYTPCEHLDAMTLLDDVIGAGLGTPSVVGHHENGKEAWGQVSLGTEVIAHGDKITGLLSVINGHGGRSGWLMGLTGTRAVCCNTVGHAKLDLRRQGSGIRKKGAFHDRKKLIESAVHEATIRFQLQADQFRSWARTTLTAEGMECILDAFFPLTTKKEQKTGAALGRALNQRKELTRLTEECVGRDSTLLDGSMTLWTAYNAVTQWERERTIRGTVAAADDYAAESMRMYRSIYGDGQDIRETAQRVFVRLAG